MQMERVGHSTARDRWCCPCQGDRHAYLVLPCAQMRAKLGKLHLDNAAVWDREHRREATPGWVAHEAPWPIRGAYLAICWIMDIIYDRRPIQRFWFLEVVARMPYFSYISMLHLYESLGWWRAGAELRKVRLQCLAVGCRAPHLTGSAMPCTCQQLWRGSVPVKRVKR